jgi:hypothetical protein
MPGNQPGTILACTNPDCGCTLRIEAPCPHGDTYTCACGHLLAPLETNPLIHSATHGFP